MFLCDVDADAIGSGTQIENHWSWEIKEFKSCRQINGMLKYCIKVKIKELEADCATSYKGLAGYSAIVKSV